MTRRRRRNDPQRPQEAVLGGFYARITPTPRGYLPCGRCGTESITVEAVGGLCLVCKVKKRTSPRGDAEGISGSESV
jgi:hypothetical protein